MAAPATTSTWMEAAFLSAREEFLGNLTNKALVNSLKTEIATARDVYDAAKKIEQQQAKTKTYRGLKRIEPLIKLFKEYGEVVETFVQAKPDVLSLIWGPLKFLLLAASVLTAAFEKIVKILGDVGRVLPGFQQYAALFPQNDDIRRVLCLFFEDILNLYAVLLNFVTDRRLTLILEPFWPNVRAKIDKIQESIENHKALMTMNVTLEDISRAQRARKQALEEFDRAQKFRDHQTFSTIRNEVRPETHHTKLADILQRTSAGSGKWLDRDDNFMKWLDPLDRTARCLWLCGIPGAGKTYLTGNIIQRMQKTGQCVLFAFISHETQSVGLTLNVLQSLLFQALEEVPSLRLLLPDPSDPDHKKLAREQGFVKELLCTILKSIGPTFMVLDGLDEIEEDALKDLLPVILDMEKNCPETKVLFSSREARHIALVLEKHATTTTLRVDKNNTGDIQAFVQTESSDLLLEMESCGAGEQERSRIQGALESIATKSEGMFLYAKLVLHVVKDHRTPSEIEAEVENLPDGLNQAYGRVMSRIEDKISSTLRTVVHRILMWIACAKRPLREEELLQILVVDIGADDFVRGRKDYRDIRRACGPIIEVLDGVVGFVHFSAKEYLLHEQSNHFLKLADAHLNATLTCATYLCYSSLDVLFDGAEELVDIDRQILDGDFVFVEYAVLHFLEHLQAWISAKDSQDSTDRIRETLGQLNESRRYGTYKESKPPNSYTDRFTIFQEDPELQQCLASGAYFFTGVTTGMLAIDETTGSSEHEPLAFFSALTALRQYLENMTCGGSNHNGACQCRQLEKLYGPELYRCSKPFCSAYISGFRTRESRDEHLAIHKPLSFKCSESGCFYADVGFRSNVEHSRHMVSAHQQLDILVADESYNGLTPLPQGDQFVVLQDAIISNRDDAVRQLITEGSRLKSHQDFERLIETAAWHSSPELLQWLLDYYALPHVQTKLTGFSDKGLETNALAMAIEAENLPNIKFLLSRGVSIVTGSRPYLHYWAPSGIYGTKCGLVRALRHWNPELIRFLVADCGVALPDKWSGDGHPAEVFAPWHISEANNIEDVRHQFAGIKKYLPWPEAYARGVYHAVGTRLYSVVKVCLENGGDPNGICYEQTPLRRNITNFRCSIQIAELLLEAGADPNILYTPGGKKSSTLALVVAKHSCGVEHAKLLLRYEADPNLGDISPLYESVRQGKPEFVKVLLQHGANPTAPGHKAVESLSGMKKIERYFGAPWKEVVRTIQSGKTIEGGYSRRRA